jgi:Uma2 family endonuclease
MSVLDRVEYAVGSQPNGSRVRFTVEQAYKIAEMFPGGRWELIEGDIISKMGQKPQHAYVIQTLDELLNRLFPGRIRIQLPLSLPGEYTEPEPDAVILNKHCRDFFERHPGPADVTLLIEVSDTTLEMDIGTKKRLYARAGIQEYCVVDLQHRRTFVCREPAGDEYKLVRIFSENEACCSLSAPEFGFCLREVLPQ